MTFLSSKGKYENFKTKSSAHSKIDGKIFTFGSEVGTRAFHKKDKWNLFTSIGFMQNPFVRARTATELDLDAVTVPVVKISGEIVLKKSKTFLMEVKPELFGLGSATNAAYKVKRGIGFFNSLKITQNTAKGRGFYFSLDFGYTHQNTTISKQSYSQVGVTFGIPFVFMGLD